MLYIVGTPIGNLRDITFRAIETLKNVDIILAEDTRRTKILLDNYGIATNTPEVDDDTSGVEKRRKLVSFHEHSTQEKIDWVIRELESGQDIALVVDAGTPGVADPAGRLVASLLVYGRRKNQKTRDQLPVTRVIPIPGVSALSTMLSISGMQNEPCLFLGYLPKKKGRQTLLEQLSEASEKSEARGTRRRGLFKTIVLFESPHRIQRTIRDLNETFGPTTKLVIGRELTKQFEEISWTTLGEAIKQDWPTRGEYTLLTGIG